MPDPNQPNSNSPTVTDSSQPTVSPTVTPVIPSVDPIVSSSPVQQPVADVPTFFPTEDVPSVPDFQAVTTEVSSVSNPASPVPPMNSSTVQQVTDTGSAAPIDTPTDSFIPTISTPKKKFGGGKIIATILGLFLLVGGVGAGIVLTQQQQVLAPKAVSPGGCVCVDSKGLDAGSGNCRSNGSCDCGANKVKNNKCTSSNNPGPGNGSACANTSGSCKGKNAGEIIDVCYQGSHGSPDNDLSLQCQGTGLNPICAANIINTPGACGSTPGGNSGGSGPTGTGCAPGYTAYTSPACQDHVFTECKNGQLCTTPVYDCFKNGTGHSCGPTQCNNTATNVVCSGTQNGTQTCVNSPTCSTGGNSPTPTPTATPIGGQCTNIKAYSATWVLLTAAQLSTQTVGTTINFCVTGTTTAGTFDEAQFTINTVQQAITTTKRPGNQDFCQSYVIPAATTTFNITAKIHHVTLGWL